MKIDTGGQSYNVASAATGNTALGFGIAEDMGFKSPKEVPNERMALSCYKKAVEKLKDPDAGFSVRKYFKPKMYADSATM